MPTTVSDKTGDHFSEVFGNKRGADRPEEDAAPPIDGGLTPSVLCAGGCGKLIQLSDIKDRDGDVGPLCCSQCFSSGVKSIVASLQGTQQNPPSHGAPAKAAKRYTRRTISAANRENRKTNKRRWRKCFFSRPFGHEWVPPDAAEDWEEPYRCVGCGKRRKK